MCAAAPAPPFCALCLGFFRLRSVSHKKWDSSFVFPFLSWSWQVRIFFFGRLSSFLRWHTQCFSICTFWLIFSERFLQPLLLQASMRFWITTQLRTPTASSLLLTSKPDSRFSRQVSRTCVGRTIQTTKMSAGLIRMEWTDSSHVFEDRASLAFGTLDVCVCLFIKVNFHSESKSACRWVFCCGEPRNSDNCHKGFDSDVQSWTWV